ncbi:hypothetical protein HY095_03480 [Candidatus Micrarchaeota archaeon]|nr:hypothetical protein [Candidatus Micrarchaeota archaeon]
MKNRNFHPSSRFGGPGKGGPSSRPGGPRRFGGRPGGSASGRPSGFSPRPGGGQPREAVNQASIQSRDRRKVGHRLFLLKKAKEMVREAYTGKGASLIQAIRAIDDLDSAKSLLFTRMDEWFKINFPEFSIESEETYAKIVSNFGSRESIDFGKLSEIAGEAKATTLASRANESFGSPLTIQQANALRDLSHAVIALGESRRQLEKFVGAEADAVLKNVAHLSDALVAARLLSAAGSLEKLAEMPSSTIQVIGAEKSLFKHLRTHGRSPPPKHGLIFQSPLLRSAPKDQRGRIARALAGKLAIAAKADCFTGNFIAPLLKEQLEERLAEIRRGKGKA